MDSKHFLRENRNVYGGETQKLYGANDKNLFEIKEAVEAERHKLGGINPISKQPYYLFDTVQQFPISGGSLHSKEYAYEIYTLVKSRKPDRIEAFYFNNSFAPTQSFSLILNPQSLLYAFVSIRGSQNGANQVLRVLTNEVNSGWINYSAVNGFQSQSFIFFDQLSSDGLFSAPVNLQIHGYLIS